MNNPDTTSRIGFINIKRLNILSYCGGVLVNSINKREIFIFYIQGPMKLRIQNDGTTIKKKYMIL